MTDTHCHLDDERYEQDLPEVLARAHGAGITRMITIGCDLPTSRRAVEIARRTEGVYAAVGVHPSECGKASASDLDEIGRLAHDPRVVAIGECGMDYFRAETSKSEQESAFRRQIAIARACGKPLVIHCREALPDVLAILADAGARDAGGVFHCYAGSAGELSGVLDLGFLAAFGGTSTFPKNDKGRQAAAACPERSILLETDAPYLAPQAYRGRRNEPAYVAETARVLAEVRKTTVSGLAAATDANASRLFRIP